MPARSAGANPVRQATASCGEVSQVTWVIAMPPRSWASTSRHQPVQHPGAAVQAAAALPGRPARSGLRGRRW